MKLLAWFRRRRQREQELDEEIRSHLAMAIRERIEQGEDPAEAEANARREFGNATLVKEVTREMWGWSWLESLIQDLRYGLRQLRRSSGFTAVAVITLALGIGANTAIFSVVNGILLRPLPYPEPTRLVSVQEHGEQFGSPTSYPDFFDWRTQNDVFSSIASYRVQDFTLTGHGEPRHLQGTVVSSGLLPVLQVKPILGRGFEPQDEKAGARVTLLSNALWREEFHSDPSIAGSGVTLNRQSFTVIGVMPAGFRFPPTFQGDLWTTCAIDTRNPKEERGYSWLSVIARLKPSVTLVQARADMNVIARRLAQQYPASNARRTTIRVVPELDRIVGTARLPLFILLGVVAGVLLIACVNLANLSLARNVVRRKEIAVRSALGAGRERLIRQLLTESILLSLLGGLCGVALADMSTRALIAIVPRAIPRAAEVGVDRHVLAFALVLSIVTGLLFGLLPALESSRTNLVGSLKEAGQTSSEGSRHRRFRGALITAETALALVLLTGAGLLIASYLQLMRADPGFNPRHLLTLDFALPTPPYTVDQTVSFYNELLSRLRSAPGVKAAVGAWPLPFSGDPTSGFDIEGRSFPPGYFPVARVHVVSLGYFQALGIGLREGRDFTARDDMRSPQVVIVDKAFARAFFPNQHPVGKRIRPIFSMADQPPWREIVGVVNNTKEMGVAEDFRPQYYIPFGQFRGFEPSIVVRTSSASLRLTPMVRKIVASLDKNVPVYDVQSMEQLASASVARERFNTLLFGFFGALALVLAAVGIYGVVAYSVSQTRHEIGIRMALGAQRRDILVLVVRNGLKHVIIGLAVGLAAALALTRLISSLLYGVRPTDPLTFIVVSLVLSSVALLACYIPARRAAKIDPMVALRHE